MFIYVAKSETGPVKIGVSQNHVNRMRQIGRHGHGEAEAVHLIECDRAQAFAAERFAHTMLRSCNVEGEWFSCGVETARSCVDIAYHQAKSGRTISYFAVITDGIGTVPDFPRIRFAATNTSLLVQHLEFAVQDEAARLIQSGQPVPFPTSLDDLATKEAIWLRLEPQWPGKSIRVQITLDDRLISAIDKVAQNRSGFLAEAARDLLARRRALMAA